MVYSMKTLGSGDAIANSTIKAMKKSTTRNGVKVTTQDMRIVGLNRKMQKKQVNSK